MAASNFTTEYIEAARIVFSHWLLLYYNVWLFVSIEIRNYEFLIQMSKTVGNLVMAEQTDDNYESCMVG